MALGCSGFTHLQAETTDRASTPHSDAQLERRLAACEADLVFVGHPHIPLDRQVGKRRVINLGSISNPITPGLQATYALLDANEAGHTIQFRRVDYDHQAVIKAIVLTPEYNWLILVFGEPLRKYLYFISSYSPVLDS